MSDKVFYKKVIPVVFSVGTFIIAASIVWVLLKDEVDYHAKETESCTQISIQFFQSCSANSDRFDACTAERRIVFDECMAERVKQ